MAPTTFNPNSAMNQLLQTMLKDEPSLVLQTPSNDKQFVLALAHLPTGETELKNSSRCRPHGLINRIKRMYVLVATCLAPEALVTLSLRAKRITFSCGLTCSPGYLGSLTDGSEAWMAATESMTDQDESWTNSPAAVSLARSPPGVG